MATKAKLTVSIDKELMRDLRAASREQRRATSHLVEEALRLWRRRKLDQELTEGYRAMAGEDVTTSEEWLQLVQEAID